MFKGLGDLTSLLKQAHEMQGRMREMQETLARVRVQGTAGGGMVTAEVNGQQKLLSCRIEKSLLEAQDPEMIEELVVSAVNQAMDKAREAASGEMSKVAGGLNLPGLGDMLSKFGGGGPSGT